MNRIEIGIQRITNDKYEYQIIKGKSRKAALLETFQRFGLFNNESKNDMILGTISGVSLCQTVSIDKPHILSIDGEPYATLDKSGVYRVDVRCMIQGIHTLSIKPT